MRSLLLSWTVILLLRTTLGSTEVNSKGSPHVLAFTFEAWDPLEKQWKSSTDVEKGSDIRLICTIDRNLSREFKIMKLHDTNALEPLQYPNSRQLVHEIPNLECDRLGIYVCENGLGGNKTTELGIFNCEPRFCVAEEQSKITTVAPNQIKSFSVCVSAYPDISVTRLASTFEKRSAESEMGSQDDNDMPIEAKEGVFDTWKYEFESDPEKFGVFTVNITKTQICQDDYGEHIFGIFTTHRGERKQLNYTLVFKPLDPPECPWEIRVDTRGYHTITLTWEPGLGRGAEQLFYIFISTNNVTWEKYREVTMENLITVKDLEHNTQFAFRVISANMFMKEIDANRCLQTVYGKTEKDPNYAETPNTTTPLIDADQDTSRSDNNGTLILVVTLISVLIVVGIAVLIGFFLILKKGNLLGTVNCNRQPSLSNSTPSRSRSADLADDVANSGSLIHDHSSCGEEHLYTEVD